MAKHKDQKWIELLSGLAMAALWSPEFAPETIQLRNKLKHYKRCSQITSWEIRIGGEDYDEMGFAYNIERRVIGVIFKRYSQEWEFPG